VESLKEASCHARSVTLGRRSTSLVRPALHRDGALGVEQGDDLVELPDVIRDSTLSV
jgi:hypothetical protein